VVHYKVEKDETKTYLDPNHTHFILVDDGSKGEYGKEIELRASLERRVITSKQKTNFTCHEGCMNLKGNFA